MLTRESYLIYMSIILELCCSYVLVMLQICLLLLHNVLKNTTFKIIGDYKKAEIDSLSLFPFIFPSRNHTFPALYLVPSFLGL